jgi:muramoyltetrapeptide carboxypeptidase LdcA involved in peptidoglycan recycling
MGQPTQPTKTPVFPRRLKPGDQIRVLALSRSIGGVLQSSKLTEADVAFAQAQLQSLGLSVSFGRHAWECNEHLTAPIQARLDDLREALNDVSVRGILAVTGGIGAVQLLDGVDYGLFTAYPKILCGYSDVAYVANAIYSRTGLVTYYGPNFTSFMMRQGAEYTLQNFKTCLFESGAMDILPSREWSDDAWATDQEQRAFFKNDGWWPINVGAAEGTIVGGSGFCLTMLQGSIYYPPLNDAIVFLEQPGEGKASLMALDSTLRALSFQRGFDRVRGIVIGRYPRSAGITHDNLVRLVQAIPALARVPVLANCDFGHTTPMLTLPIGGRCHISARDGNAEILITVH